MNSIDSAARLFFGPLVEKHWRFDQLMVVLAGNDLFKGGVFMAVLWWAWFRQHPARARTRHHLVATIVGCVVAVCAGRALALALGSHDGGAGFSAPGVGRINSFPSDHAVLFFALATGLWFVSRRLGMLAFGYSAVFIALPRMYLGYHSPTDILGGALIGIPIVLLANLYLPQRKRIQQLVAFSDAQPQYFYPLFFLVTYQVAELFESTRSIAGMLFKLIRRAVSPSLF